MSRKRLLWFLCLSTIVCTFLLCILLRRFPLEEKMVRLASLWMSWMLKAEHWMAVMGAGIGSYIFLQAVFLWRRHQVLYESKEMLKLALKVGKMGIWDHNFLTGKIVWSEGTIATLFGRSDAAFQGTYKEFWDWIHPLDRTHIEIPTHFSMQREGEFQIEFRTIWPDGNIHWICAQGKVFFDIEGRPVRAVGIGTDVTDRKRAEEALREREEEIRSLFEAHSVGIVFSDSKGNVKTANHAFLELFGYTREDIDSGRFNWTQVLFTEPAVPPDSLQSIHEKEYLRKDGKKVPLRVEIARLGKTKENAIGFVLDLTESQKAKEESARDRLLFQRITETSPDIIYVYDLLKQQNLYVNRAGQLLLGYSIEELGSITRSNFASLIHPEDEKEVLENYRQFVTSRDREFLDLEFRIRRADGNYLWFRNRVIVFSRSWDSRAHQLLGLFQDITDHKNAEKALRESEERERARAKQLEILMNAVPATVWIAHDPACQRITGNWAAYQLVRMEPGSNQSKTAPEGEVPNHFRFMRDGVEIPCEALPLQIAAGQGVEIREAELDVVFNDGVTQHLFGNATPLFDRHGQPQGAIAIFVDITERLRVEQALRLSEERFRSLVAVTAAVVWTADDKGNFIAPQASWEVFTGQGFDGHQKMGWIAMFHADDQIRIKAQLEQGVQPQGLYEIEGRLFCAKEQQYRYVFIRAVPLLCGDGSLREWVGIITDIHERKKAEQARLGLLAQEQRARAEAERANRMKDEFLATISHELRTPLTAIMGWIHMLRMEESDAATVAMAIETIERNAKSQAQLIEDILDVSRIVTGKLRLQLEKVQCTQVIQAALDAVLPPLQSKGIQLHVQLDSEVGPIFADAGRFQQIVWNLLSNAIKFTPQGGNIFVDVHRVENQVRIQIRDTGEGISPDFLPYVFDRFRQEDGTLTRKHGGLGLGLAIVRHLVELHGGTIQAESQGQGKGSTFAVLLPATQPAEVLKPLLLAPQTQVRAVSPEDGSFASLVRLNHISILVVDDAPDILSMLGAILRGCGADVQLATNAREAYELIQKESFDILVSDLAMPEEDGYSLLQKIRALPDENRARVAAVALTAHVRVEDRVRALAAGFQMFIAKPVEPTEIVSVIADLVRTQKKRSLSTKPV